MEKISGYKNLHSGKNIFILSSGPSLADLDLSLLKNKIVMGLNRSTQIYPTPYYQCVFDYRLFDLFPESYRNVRQLFTLQDRPFGLPLKLLGGDGFSQDLEEGIYSGYTISYFALQVVAYMGFKNIFYLGLDLKHEGPKTHFFGQDPQTLNHEQTEFPRMIKMLNYSAEVLTSTDINVYNCSHESTLECFPKISYEEALAF
ncbi:MAG: hypothetical protein HOL15_01790 [Nitrospinaceae bacterium]|jgi:hypothetical protein|nr:hypothetical protein [Nitrospina sp.]MBT5375524.1 hypothetical protein [Nitrospinaceae bacterium]MBT5868319.1 hypothetical protein [Nitrospinaceae bacterium]MBT6347496.1 hypothetical protein [Nitrospina sp.]